MTSAKDARSRAARAVALAEEIRVLALRLLGWARMASRFSLVGGALCAVAVWEVFAWRLPAFVVALIVFLAPAVVLWWYERMLRSLVGLPDALTESWAEFREDRALHAEPESESRLRRAGGPRVMWRMVGELYQLRQVLVDVVVNARALVNPLPHVVGGIAALAAIVVALLLPLLTLVAIAF
ncbi:MAG: hypothetical protein IT198_07575 [Acidimicrobiia bacterium]|nr:hypothetical protein [Acidimicrobiia bacterium]